MTTVSTFFGSPTTPHSPAAPPTGREAAIRLVLRLGQALHRYGTPAFRLEEALGSTSAALGVPGDFFATPTAIFASFHAEHSGPGRTFGLETSLVRAEPGEINLTKQAHLDELIGELSSARLGVEEGARRVEEILAAPRAWRGPLYVLAHGLASGAAAHFLGGGLREIFAATFLGGCVGALDSLGRRVRSVRRVLEPLAAGVVAFLAAGLAHAFGVSQGVAVLAGVVVLLPGFTLTVGVNELATRHLVSGVSRLASAALLFVVIGVGVLAGGRAGAMVFGHPLVLASIPSPAWLGWAALLLAPLAAGMLFQAPLREAGWVLLTGLLALEGTRMGAAHFGPALGAFAGALGVGLLGNAYARFAGRPAATLLVPGVLMLVPGAVGFRSFQALLHQDSTSGIQIAFQAILVAVSLVTGLLVANELLPPRKSG